MREVRVDSRRRSRPRQNKESVTWHSTMETGSEEWTTTERKGKPPVPSSFPRLLPYSRTRRIFIWLGLQFGRRESTSVEYQIVVWDTGHHTCPTKRKRGLVIMGIREETDGRETQRCHIPNRPNPGPLHTPRYTRGKRERDSVCSLPLTVIRDYSDFLSLFNVFIYGRSFLRSSTVITIKRQKRIVDRILTTS